MPKLNNGVDSPPALPPSALFLAGGVSSCFIGLPNWLAAPTLCEGDLGTPNVAFDETLEIAPALLGIKLNIGVGASVFPVVESAATDDVDPKDGCWGCVDCPAPNRLLDVFVFLAPNRDPTLLPAGVAVEPVFAIRDVVAGALSAWLSNPTADLAPAGFDRDVSAGLFA